jgi:hypothetical protein
MGAESTVGSSGLETNICREDSLASVINAATPAEPSSAAPRRRNYTWSELMKRVWGLDVLECPRCRAHMRILADIHSPDAIQKILKCLDLPTRAPPISPCAGEPFSTSA